MSPITVVQNRLCGFASVHQLQRVQDEALQKYADRVMSGEVGSKRPPHTRKLTKAPYLQQQSRFSQLPTELRLMIFRNLLLSDKPLDWKFSTDGPNFNFEPDILAVCQTWYFEAADILYRENTFTIFFKPDNGYPVGFLRSLYPADCSKGGFGLGQRFPSGIEKYATKFLVRLWLHPFHRKVTSEARAFRLLPVFCRAVTNLLIGGDVNLQPWSRDGNYSVEAFDAVSYWIPALRLLRCKTFQVLSPTAHGPIFYMGSIWHEEDLLTVDNILDGIRCLTTEITSDVRPVDSYMQLFAANRALTRLRMSLSKEADRKWVDQQIGILEGLVRRQDHKGFQELWQQLQRLTCANEQDTEMGRVRKHKFCSFKVRLH